MTAFCASLDCIKWWEKRRAFDILNNEHLCSGQAQHHIFLNKGWLNRHFTWRPCCWVFVLWWHWHGDCPSALLLSCPVSRAIRRRCLCVLPYRLVVRWWRSPAAAAAWPARWPKGTRVESTRAHADRDWAACLGTGRKNHFTRCLTAKGFAWTRNHILVCISVHLLPFVQYVNVGYKNEKDNHYFLLSNMRL